MGDNYVYWLLYNRSLSSQNFLDNMNAPMKLNEYALQVSQSVENALMNWIVKQKDFEDEPNIQSNYTYQNYPKVQSRYFKGFDSSSTQGPFWLFIPIMISFLSVLNELIGEKEKKLRQGLHLFGIGNLSYWLSWVIYLFLFDILFTGTIMIAGFLFQFGIFINSPIYLMFPTFFMEIFAYHCLAVMLVRASVIILEHTDS